MLVALSIRDIVLIDRLSLDLEPGLSAFTGETGAGKSILLDALGLTLGARANSSLVRQGADQAIVTAEFLIPDDHPAHVILAEHEMPADDTLIIRRSIGRDGRSRAFVNDQPSSVSLLRQLGESLVEIHGQFDTHGLLNPNTHRALLDAFGRLDTERTATANAWTAWRAIEQKRRTLAEEIERARREEDYLRHAVAELDALSPDSGEEERLAEQRTLLMHREKLIEALTVASDALMGDGGADQRLNAAWRALDRVADKAGGRLEPVVAALDRSLAELQEASSALQAASADTESDSETLESVEDRLFQLRDVARKHGVAVEDLPSLREDLAGRLALLEDQTDALQSLAAESDRARATYQDAAEALSCARQAAAARLDAGVTEELAPLKLDRAVFATSVEPLNEDDWGPNGRDQVRFLVATNPGAAPGPLNRIASGGELARFMLALKVVLASASTVPCLVFDEVDSGIGGAVASAVGERLARLGQSVQVLVVTHSPQVAAVASRHWQVLKDQKADSTRTDVTALSDEERAEELARMLSGATVTDEARAAARRLLDAHSDHSQF